MIPGASPRIVLATRPVNCRRGHNALAATAAVEFDLDIYSGVIVIFRSKRGDRLKLLAWDGIGLVLTHSSGFSEGIGGTPSTARIQAPRIEHARNRANNRIYSFVHAVMAVSKPPSAGIPRQAKFGIAAGPAMTSPADRTKSTG